MKKMMALVLAMALVFSLTACSSSSTTSSTDSGNASVESSSDTISGPEDLAGKTIGVQEGTTGDIFISADFEEDYPDSIMRYKTVYEAAQALLTGKVDCVVIDDLVAEAIVEANEGLKILDTEYVVEDYALYINSDEEELLALVNEAIATLWENGTMDDIIAYYIEGDETATGYHEQTLDSYPNGTITVAVNPYFSPYVYYEGEVIWGIDADMIRAIGDLLGMEIVFSAMDFSASLVAVQTGKSTMAIGGITMTEERAQSGLFTDTYYSGRQVIIVAE